MSIKQQLKYYLIVLGFPVFIVLHGLNEYAGLFAARPVLVLLGNYLFIAAGIGLVSHLIFRSFSKSLVFSFLALAIFFLFGAFKDFAESHKWLNAITTYKFLLPELLALVIVVFFLLKRKAHPPVRFAGFLSILLVVLIGLELMLLGYHYFVSGKSRADISSRDEAMINNLQKAPPSKKPFIFWIVFDEYSGSQVMKKKWHFDNPIDTALRNRGFFVADSASSPYNYTIYSLGATLAMRYFDEYQNHTVVDFADGVRRRLSIKDNTVIAALKNYGYAIQNYTVYDLKDNPTVGTRDYDFEALKLIDDQTLVSRMIRNVGFNFTNIWSGDKKLKDSLAAVKYVSDLAASKDSVLQLSIDVAREKRNDTIPSFFMFHLMQTHAPFVYKEDGSFDFSLTDMTGVDRYLPNLKYSNRLVTGIVDSIKNMYQGKDYVIVLQGDHAYKFSEKDPLFDASCNILYAVYCSDNNYKHWNNSLNSVNTFRFLFNKYFDARLPLLPDLSYNLHERGIPVNSDRFLLFTFSTE